MSWLWVRRARYEAFRMLANQQITALERERDQLRAELATYKQRKPRTRKPPKVTEAQLADLTPEQRHWVKTGTVLKENPAQQIDRAIRQVAGVDRPLERHLRQFASEQLAAEVPVSQIVAMILNGMEAPV